MPRGMSFYANIKCVPPLSDEEIVDLKSAGFRYAIDGHAGTQTILYATGNVLFAYDVVFERSGRIMKYIQ